MKKTLVELYAAEKAGLGCIDELETLVAACYGWTKEELAGKYQEITKKINEYASGCSNEQFKRFIYLEYLNLFFKEG